jgi:hypothetical protein
MQRKYNFCKLATSNLAKKCLNPGILIEGEGSVWLTSLSQLV